MAQIELHFDRCDPSECEMQLFWWSPSTLKPQHVAFPSDDMLRLIHTWASVKSVVDSPYDELWQERIHSSWKLKENLWQQQHCK
tara:strand:- start:34008 stop:34259 length:252 start_codon:yes stop_codon:yes gene_type:complete